MATLMTTRDTSPASLWAVWFFPRGAFSTLTQKTRVFLLVGLVLGASILPAVTFVSKANVAMAMEKQMKRTGTWEKLPPDNREATLEKIAQAMTYLAPGGAFLKRALYLFGLGLLAWFLLKATREDLRLSVVLAAVALGLTPVLLQDLLETLVFLVRDASSLDLDAPLKSHLGAFLPQTWPKKLLALAGGIDLFKLWVAFLVGFGLKVAVNTKSNLPYMLSFGAHGALVALAVATA